LKLSKVPNAAAAARSLEDLRRRIAQSLWAIQSARPGYAERSGLRRTVGLGAFSYHTPGLR
jgi:uncharacterized protein involved in exopolysaccharide biosynthesis